MYVLQGMRRDMPGRHRNTRQDPRHAPLPGPHGGRLPQRTGQGLPVDGELLQPVRNGAGRARRLDRPVGLRSSHTRPGCADGRVPVLGRLRGLLRRSEPEGDGGNRPAHARGRRGLRHPRSGRAVHRRSGAPFRERVRFPDARPAEHRDPGGARGEEGDHPVSALLQHPEERVSTVRRRVRGHPSQPTSVRTGGDGPDRAEGRIRAEGHLPRLVLPRSS